MSKQVPSKIWMDKLSFMLLREPQTQNQLISLLRDANERQLIDVNALAMIESILDYSKLRARDVMIPRPQMVILEQDQTAAEVLPFIIQSAHSRFPVVNHTRDEILGILLVKDLLPLLAQHSTDQKFIQTLARPAIIVPESQRLNRLLKDFQKKRHHMAIVTNEYGDISGLITIEDILEQIVGDIVDETDTKELETNIRPLDNASYIIKALTPVEEINAYFNCHFDNEDVDTFGGLIIKKLGYLPRMNEKIHCPPFLITITDANDRQLNRLHALYDPHSKNSKS